MQLKIGNVQLENTVVFAPIAGFSEVGFRHLCSKYGAGLVYTELVSAKGLCYGNKGTEELLAREDFSTPCAVQLFGSDPEFMFKAAKDDRLANFEIVDINMGCPVKKVFNNGDGSALMKNPELITEIVQAVCEGAKRPVTVKMRAGIEHGKPLAVECALAAQKGGASAVCVHPRYRDQFYSGVADHAITKAVKEAVDVPVIANGDIIDIKSLEFVKNLTNADGFMIGRGALGRPWIFCELQNEVQNTHENECPNVRLNTLEKEQKDEFSTQNERDVKSDIYEHIAVLRKYMPDFTVANVMKLQLCYYAKGGKDAKNVRVDVGKAKNLDDIFSIVETRFS